MLLAVSSLTSPCLWARGLDFADGDIAVVVVFLSDAIETAALGEAMNPLLEVSTFHICSLCLFTWTSQWL